LIIVADDHADVRLMVKSILERSGYEVEVVSDGDQALALARQKVPQLIVLDIMMPQMNGLDVLVQLRGHDETRNIPVILLTGKTLGTDAAAAFGLGADYYIAKPFDVEQLLCGVRTLLPARPC